MAYLVNLTPRAERDLANLYAKINAEESDAALKWYRDFKATLLSLEEQPNRCPKTPENAQLRHLLFGSKPHVYRVIFCVSKHQKRVDVLHIRHEAQDRFKASNVGQLHPPD